MNPNQQQHSHPWLVGIGIIVLIALLFGIGSVIKRQWDAHENAPKMERERKLQDFKKERQKRANKNAQRKAEEQADAKSTKQQEAIDKEANKPTPKPKKVSKPKTRRKKAHHYISPRLLINNQLRADRRQDKSFAQRIVYAPKRNTVYVALNKHGLSLVHNKRWHNVAYRNLNTVSKQNNQLRHINKKIHTRFVK